MNPQAHTTAKGIRRKLVLGLVAIASVAFASVAGGPVLGAAGFMDAPGQQKRNFTISGSLSTELSPGVSAPLNLTFDNPNQQALAIEELQVTVVRTSAGACAADNFSATAFTGPYPITIPSGNSTLAGAVADSSKWPRVGMVNKPVNQDACKGVSVSLAYSAKASK